MDSSQELWEEFQQQFLIKLYSADYQETLDDKLVSMSSVTGPLQGMQVASGTLQPKASSGLASGTSGKQKTFQRRTSLKNEDLRDQMVQAAMTSPVPSPRANGTGAGGDFFITEAPDFSDEIEQSNVSSREGNGPTRKCFLLYGRAAASSDTAAVALNRANTNKYQTHLLASRSQGQGASTAASRQPTLPLLLRLS